MGMMWAVVASGGSVGWNGIVVLWLELVSVPLGSLIVIVLFGDFDFGIFGGCCMLVVPILPQSE